MFFFYYLLSSWKVGGRKTIISCFNLRNNIYTFLWSTYIRSPYILSFLLTLFFSLREGEKWIIQKVEDCNCPFSLNSRIFSVIQYWLFHGGVFHFNDLLYSMFFMDLLKGYRMKPVIFIKNGIFTPLSGKEWYFHLPRGKIIGWGPKGGGNAPLFFTC